MLAVPPIHCSLKMLLKKIGQITTYSPLVKIWHFTNLRFVQNLSWLPLVWNFIMQVLCWILFYFIWSCIFMYFVFSEERNIKVKQNHIFSHVFNRVRLRKSNWTNLGWIKYQISNHMEANCDLCMIKKILAGLLCKKWYCLYHLNKQVVEIKR